MLVFGKLCHFILIHLSYIMQEKSRYHLFSFVTGKGSGYISAVALRIVAWLWLLNRYIDYFFHFV